MTHPRSRKKSTSGVNHRTKSPESPTPTSITKTISKSPETDRVFTDNEEIHLLKTLSQSPNNSLTSPSLSDHFNGSFTESQITEKLKKLKEKYHKFARSKSLMKTPHDGEIYELGRKIWGRNAAKGKQLLVVANDDTHEDVNLDEFSFLMNEIPSLFQRNEYCYEGFRRLGKMKLKEMNEKWMELKLEESELIVNKTQLYHEHLKLVVESSKVSRSSN